MDAHAAGPDHAWALHLPDEPDDDAHPGSTDPASDLLVTGDEARLQQVLANLLANARTHTPPGTHVDVRVGRTGDTVQLTISDDGPGIPADLRTTLFHRFTRGDTARNRAGGSTGLGLAIAESIVTAHGGTIDVRSATAAEPGPTGTRCAASATTLSCRSAMPRPRAMR